MGARGAPVGAVPPSVRPSRGVPVRPPVRPSRGASVRPVGFPWGFRPSDRPVGLPSARPPVPWAFVGLPSVRLRVRPSRGAPVRPPVRPPDRGAPVGVYKERFMLKYIKSIQKYMKYIEK